MNSIFQGKSKLLLAKVTYNGMDTMVPVTQIKDISKTTRMFIETTLDGTSTISTAPGGPVACTINLMDLPPNYEQPYVSPAKLYLKKIDTDTGTDKQIDIQLYYAYPSGTPGVSKDAATPLVHFKGKVKQVSMSTVPVENIHVLITSLTLLGEFVTGRGAQ